MKFEHQVRNSFSHIPPLGFAKQCLRRDKRPLRGDKEMEAALFSPSLLEILAKQSEEKLKEC